MKKPFRFSWITSSMLFSSMCCYSSSLHAIETVVSSTADDGSNGTLRYAINEVNSNDGGTIFFAPGLSGQVITLNSPLPPLNANISINDPSPVHCTIDGTGLHQAFFVQSGTVHIRDLTIQNAAAIGGAGGNGFNSGGAGGGGAGLGGGLFVNQASDVSIRNVHFIGNKAQGGAGGSHVNLGDYAGAGGGGGGCNYEINSKGGNGGIPDTEVVGNLAYAGLGSGGGGGGNSPGGDGTNLQGGKGGGSGGIFTGGTGGDGAAIDWMFQLGRYGWTSWVPTSSRCATEAAGAQDFGGGGGAGAILTSLSYYHYTDQGFSYYATDYIGNCSEVYGSDGGFGGGGGGGGAINWHTSLPTQVLYLGDINDGRRGGFGGGGGAGLSGGSSLYGGGTGGNSILEPGENFILVDGNQRSINQVFATSQPGGGGAGLGGAVFVRSGGTLTIVCDAGSDPTAFFDNNTVQGGSGANDGLALGSDIFINSGGSLSFTIDVPVTIAQSIASDGLVSGSGISITGSEALTLLGNNSFDGGITVAEGTLIINNNENLGTPLGAVALHNGTLEILSLNFITDRIFTLTGITNYITAAENATFNGSLLNSAILNLTATTALFNGPLSGSGALNLTTTTALFNGSLSGSGALNLNSVGSATFTQNNHLYTGAISLNSGNLVVGINLGSGSLTLNSIGATVEFSGTSAISNPIVVTRATTINSAEGARPVLMGEITGSQALTFTGPGSIVISHDNSSYTGDITLGSAVTVQVYSQNALGHGDGMITFDGGRLNFSSTAIANFFNEITINAAGGAILNDAGVQVVFEAPITCNGPLTITRGGATFLQSFTGSGSLILNGLGTTIFAHKPVLTGGISVSPGAILQINDLSTSLEFFSSSSDLTNHGTLQFNNVSGTITQSVEGQGGLSFLGGGNIILNASHVCTGGISIDSGYTVHAAIYDALPLAGPIDISDGATLVFEHTSGTANPAQVLGAGTLQMDSDFSLLLNDTNLHTGGNRLRSGTTIVSSDAGLGTGTTVLGYEDNAAELQLRSATLSVPITLQGEGADFSWTGACFVSSAIGSYNATPLWVSIADGFEAAETGNVLHFSGTNSSTGSTTFENGTLFLENVTFEGAVTFYPDAVVTASGSVGGEIALGGLTNYGALHPDGSLTVYGDFQQGAAATLTFNVQAAGACDQMSVSQSVYANGGLVVNVDGGAYAVGQEITLLSAETHIYGSFTSISAPDFLRIDVDADPGIFGSVITQSILAGASAKGNNPRNVLQNLRDIEHTPGSDLIAVLNTMVGLSQAQLSDALDQLHPALFGAFDLLNASTSSMLTSILARHPSEICCSHQADPCENLGGSVWVQPFGYFTHQDRIGEQMGFYANTVGLVGGGHYRYSSGLLFGAGAAYDSSDLRWHERRGQGHMRSASLAFYTDYTKKAFAVDASLIGSYDLFQATRKIDFSTVYRQAKHSKNGFNLTFHVGGNGDFKTRKCDIKPFADVDYFYLDQQGFKETGAQSLNLHVHHYDSHLLRSEAGVRLARSYSMGEKGCFSPMIWLSGINECHLVKNHYKANFLGESPSFEVRTFNKPIYLISPGVELSFKVGPQFGLSVRYGAELNAKIATQKMDGRLEWFF